MPYTIDRLLTGVSFEDADARTRAALQAKGFGVLTEIDVKATMKKKLAPFICAYRKNQPAFTSRIMCSTLLKAPSTLA